jgi:hypothetical protein
LRFEVPVEEVAGVAFGPVAVFGDADGGAGREIAEAAFVGADAGGDLAEDGIGVL